MLMQEKTSTVTADEMARVVATLRDGLPPPEEVKPRPTGLLCAYARDLGVAAFVNLPCRGNRIECRKTGVLSYAAKCRDDIECKFYTEG